MKTNEISSPVVNSPEAPPIPTSWSSLGLSQEALALIEKAGYTTPTEVQTQAIPHALAGEDLIASAQTGTGKTAGFVLPMIEKFAGREGTYGLILCPTREIAQQTQAVIEIFGTPRGVRSIVLIGGINMRRDAEAIQSYPQIIVATPGRLCDHLDRGNIWLDFIKVVVLDEADRMLDMGFSDQLSRIMQDVPEERQTLLFSATMSPTVERFAQRILFKPVRVAIGRPLSAASTVTQKLFWMKEESKNRELRRLLKEEPGSIIVFTRSKDMASRVWRSLHSRCVYDATFIHSDRPQDQREQALADFKSGKFRVLIATDVAGRGIHVDNVAHVVNFDLPLEPEDYVHRIGRTGRALATGKATSFATPRDRRLLADIEKLLGHAIPSETIDVSSADMNSSSSRGPSRGPSRRPGGNSRNTRGPRR
ncbi:MAG: hypothetical protein A2070_09660 [Bdellovibrionales bacterium GWC1_52_8]|nr:MAG: hypothetical protein A2X97_03500 [Bdellovibrionales bacterium GWA1_52_35]OFZ35576.1 MAG: hypothetical protein A2070_09660 [Bdellovibrionales bacterium GWC1_52_8]